MNVAIVGTGFIAAVHAQALQELGHRVEVAINGHVSKAAAFAQRWNIPRWGSDIELALEPHIDCVHICTPPTLHYSMVKQALEADKHVICEKPFCLNPEQALELVQLAQHKQRIGAVNFNVRFHEACQRARAIIASPDFGAVRLIHGSYLQEFHALPDQYMWRYIPELAGNMRATTEIGSHWMDLVQYWTGLEIKAVSAHFANFNPSRYLNEDQMMMEPSADQPTNLHLDSEDAAAITLQFSNGAVGNVLLSEVAYGHHNQLRLEVNGSKQSVWWCNEEPYHLYHSPGKFQGATQYTQAFGGGFTETFKHLFRAVYRAMELWPTGEAVDFPTFWDGYRNDLVTRAIDQSARAASKWIKL